MNEIRKNKDMFQVSCQNIENFSRNSYFQVGGLHVYVRVLILVCTPLSMVLTLLRTSTEASEGN